MLAAIVVDLLYFIIRQFPLHWWLLAWGVFLGLVVLMAQLAPVILFPIFYKFEPLQNDELKSRLTALGVRAGTRVRGVYKWNLSEKSKKANAALTGLGSTRRIILADTLLENYSVDEIEAVLAHELGHHVHRHIPKSIAVQAAMTFVGFWGANWILHYSMERLHLLGDARISPTCHCSFWELPVLSFLLTRDERLFAANERKSGPIRIRSIS